MKPWSTISLDVYVATALTLLAGWSVVCLYGLAVVHYRQRTRQKAAALAATIARNKNCAALASKRVRTMENLKQAFIAASRKVTEPDGNATRSARHLVQALNRADYDATVKGANSTDLRIGLGDGRTLVIDDNGDYWGRVANLDEYGTNDLPGYDAPFDDALDAFLWTVGANGL